MPWTHVPGQSAGRWAISVGERCERAEMAGRLVARNGCDGNVQAPSGDISNVAIGDLRFGNRVISGTCGPVLERKPVEAGRIEPVHLQRSLQEDHGLFAAAR